ncbi:MAG: hypothetical protein PHO93_02855 [Candidatus Saccharimonadaceae bacterium]|nr:hypothetical protein [Candidatus Saccharimonadaceae bacterium]
MNEYESLQRMYAELNDSSKWGNDFIKIADALAELSAIKQRAEEVKKDLREEQQALFIRSGVATNYVSIRERNIDYILKGETK